jgi:hypothetical protein
MGVPVMQHSHSGWPIAIWVEKLELHLENCPNRTASRLALTESQALISHDLTLLDCR